MSNVNELRTVRWLVGILIMITCSMVGLLLWALWAILSGILN